MKDFYQNRKYLSYIHCLNMVTVSFMLQYLIQTKYSFSGQYVLVTGGIKGNWGRENQPFPFLLFRANA